MGLNQKNEILIGEGWVRHARPAAKNSKTNFFSFLIRKKTVSHSFSYPLFNLLVPVYNEEALASLKNHFFISLSSKDYLDSKEGSLKKNVKEFLKSELNYSCDQVWLQTLPRTFGYVFNPVSFWYCYQGKNLDAVLCEVNNTFGDRHFYFINEIGKKSTAVHKAVKSFHVSPFFALEGYYTFEFKEIENGNEVRIKLFDHSGLKLDTQIALSHSPLAQVTSFYFLKKYGWITLMVILRIHYQAFKLWKKGADFFKRPEPPKESITYDSTEYKQSRSL